MIFPKFSPTLINANKPCGLLNHSEDFCTAYTTLIHYFTTFSVYLHLVCKFKLSNVYTKYLYLRHTCGTLTRMYEYLWCKYSYLCYRYRSLWRTCVVLMATHLRLKYTYFWCSFFFLRDRYSYLGRTYSYLHWSNGAYYSIQSTESAVALWWRCWAPQERYL